MQMPLALQSLNIKLKPAALLLKKPALTPTTIPPKTPPQPKQQVKPTGAKPKTKKPDPKETKKIEISPEKNQPTVREFFHPKPKEYKPIPRIAPPKLHLGSNHTPENTPKIPTNKPPSQPAPLNTPPTRQNKKSHPLTPKTSQATPKNTKKTKLTPTGAKSSTKKPKLKNQVKEVRNFDDLKIFLARKKLERAEQQAKSGGTPTSSNNTTDSQASKDSSVHTDSAANVRTQWEGSKPNLGESNCVTEQGDKK